MYALVDCNSFFASCEQIFRPDLRDKPIVVLSNNDGCIVARNAQAKALNIPDLIAYFKVKHLLKKHQVQVFSSNYELYGDISQRIMQILREFAEEIEVYSIDEAFLILADYNTENPATDNRSYQQIGEYIKKTIWKRVRMPVAVGIAKTRTMAKLASYIAKNSPRCNGVCVVRNHHPWHKVFAKIPVNKIWGVGRKYSKRLANDGIYSVWQLLNCDPKMIQRRYSVNLERTVEELNGTACYKMELKPPKKKQIISTRSFGERVTSLEALQQAISQYAARACKKLRDQDDLTCMISIFMQTSRFQENYYAPTLKLKLAYPTNDTRIITTAAKHAVSQMFQMDRRYVRAGIALTEITSRSPEQLDFLGKTQSSRSRKLMQTLDKINNLSGSGSAFFLSQGINPLWKMKRTMKSPSYTTRWQDLPRIQI